MSALYDKLHILDQYKVDDAIRAIKLMDQCTFDAFMEEFKARWCIHCGSEDPRCQCWNDE